MSARDELAYVIVQHPWIDPELFGVAKWPKGYCPTCGKSIEAGHNSPAHAEHIADAILAAGYQKPRTITTAEELDGLPVGSTVLSETIAYQKHDDDDWSWSGVGRFWHTGQIDLPATVLHEPEAKA